MRPLTILQWWHRGEWHEIGWRAFTLESAADLRRHAERLACGRGGNYRLIHPSIHNDGSPEVVVWERRTPTPPTDMDALVAALVAECAKGEAGQGWVSCRVLRRLLGEVR